MTCMEDALPNASLSSGVGSEGFLGLPMGGSLTTLLAQGIFIRMMTMFCCGLLLLIVRIGM